DALATRVANIAFENINLSGTTTSVFKGNRSTPVENLSLRNIRLSLQGEKSFWGNSADLEAKAVAFQFAHCRNIAMDNLILEGEKQAAETRLPLFDLVDVENFEQRNLINRTPHPIGENAG